MPLVLKVVLWTSQDPVRGIANAHTLFNKVNTVIQLPFAYLLVVAATRIIRGEDPILETAPKYLDRRLLDSPAIALQQVVKELGRMGKFALEALSGATEVFFTGNERLVRPARAREEAVNNLEREITVYLVELAQRSLTKAQSERLNFLYNAVNDIERIGDHAMNVLELAEYKMERDLPYSDEAIKSLKEMHERVMGAFARAWRP
ncbi:MAG: PhoU domain-containing protein [Bacillota bacterium]